MITSLGIRHIQNIFLLVYSAFLDDYSRAYVSFLRQSMSAFNKAKTPWVNLCLQTYRKHSSHTRARVRHDISADVYGHLAAFTALKCLNRFYIRFFECFRDEFMRPSTRLGTGVLLHVLTALSSLRCWSSYVAASESGRIFQLCTMDNS